MADDRAAEDLVAAVARLQRELDDMRTTMAARTVRRSTGDVEPTLRMTPKPDTLFLTGQAVNRADYPVLWQWVQEQGLVIGGLFGNGDNSTTFTLPNFSGRVLIGVGSLSPDTYTLGQLVGSARVALTVAQLATHTHTMASGHGVSTTYGHTHGHGGSHDHALDNIKYTTDANHNHSGRPGTIAEAPNAAAPGGAGALAYTTFSGGHQHGTDSHNHGVNLDALSLNNTGSGTAHENRQPSIAVNWMIWT